MSGHGERPETFDIYFARTDGRPGQYRVRKVLTRSQAWAHPAADGWRVSRVRRAPHRLGLRGYR